PSPTRMLVEGGTDADQGVVTSTPSGPLIELHQPDALVAAKRDMFAYRRSDPAVADPFGSPTSLELKGGTATALNNGGQIRFVTALGAMRATNMTMFTDGSVLLKGGDPTHRAPDAFAASNHH